MTTFDPGASEVFTHGLRFRPRSTAFLASRAAATMTEGFDVFVQEVIAAITTDPWSTAVAVPSSSVIWTGPDARVPARASRNAVLASASAIRSCGRRGPAIEGTTVDRSRVTSSEYLTASA